MKIVLIGAPINSLEEPKRPENPFPEIYLVEGDGVEGDLRVDYFDSPYLNPKHVTRKRNRREHCVAGFKPGFFDRDYYLVLKDLMEIARVWGFAGVPLGGVYQIQTPKGVYFHRKEFYKIDATSPTRVKNNVIYLTWEQQDCLDRKGFDPTSAESIDSVPKETLEECGIPAVQVGR